MSKLGCVVSGLPQVIELKQPKDFSSCELRRILDSMDKVKLLQIPDFTNDSDSLIVEREETIELEQS